MVAMNEAIRKPKSAVRGLLAELKVCSNTRNLQRGREIHAMAKQSGDDSCVYVATALVNLYSKCGCMAEAQKVFEDINQPDVVSWTSLILGYAENGNSANALEAFFRMKSLGYAANSFTYVAALKACAVSGGSFLEHGRKLHLEIGRNLNNFVSNSLMDMYTKCGSVTEARQIFEGLEKPDVVSWNTLILGYAENGEGATALELFRQMRVRGCQPDSITIVAALKACSSLVELDGSGRASCLERGTQIHSEITCHTDMFIQSALIDMYAKGGCMIRARQVFDTIKKPDVVSWTALVSGYAENGDGSSALDMFSRMRLQGCRPNSITFISALQGCASLALKEDETGKAECRSIARRIHSQVGVHWNHHVASTLIDVYAKCGSVLDAREVFDSMKNPDVVSWNALIFGYAENGEEGTALDVFERMKNQGHSPNSVTLVGALKACSLLGDLEYGSRIHAEITLGPEANCTILVTSLVDFYAKCGSLLVARKIFDFYSQARNLRTWNALVAGYSRLGDAKTVFELFEAMLDADIQPDGVTCLCILTCCSHAGISGKAIEFFESMATRYRVAPGVEHYNCMVDILARSNKLQDAIALLQCIPCKPNAVTWMTMLAACCKWKNVELGKIVFRSVISLENENAAAYVLMGQLFGSTGMLEEQELVLHLSKSQHMALPGILVPQ